MMRRTDTAGSGALSPTRVPRRLHVPLVRRTRAAIGLALCDRRGGIVVVTRGRIVQAAEVVLPADDSSSTGVTTALSDAVADVMRDAVATTRGGRSAIRRQIRPLVGVCLGRQYARAKRIEGIPIECDDASLAPIIAGAASRFFVWPPARPSRVAVRRSADGVVAAAVYDPAVVDAVVAACERSGADVALVIAEGLAAESTGHTVDPSAGDDSWATLTDLQRDAFAAIATPPHPLALLRFASARRDRRLERVHRVSIGLAACAAVTTLLAPGVVAHRSATATENELRTLLPAVQAPIAAAAELSEVSRQTEEVAEFAAERRSVTMILAQLTEALPPDAAVLSLEIDDVTATLVVVGGSVADAARALENAPAIASAQVVGMTTREPTMPAFGTTGPSLSASDAASLRERATIRLTLRPVRQPAAVAIVGVDTRSAASAVVRAGDIR